MPGMVLQGHMVTPFCARHGASHAVSFPEFISAAASLGDVGPVEKTGSLERGGTD